MIEITPEYLKMGKTEWEARVWDIDGLARETLSWNQLIAEFVRRADASGYDDIEFDGAVVSYLSSIGMKYDLPYVFHLRRLASNPLESIDAESTERRPVWIENPGGWAKLAVYTSPEEIPPPEPTGRPSTVGEWIKALKLLDPSLPLFVRCKYTGRTDWTKDCPIFTKGLSEMDPGEGILYPHATILY